MKKKDSKKLYGHVRKELRKERKIAVLQVISIVILLILGVLLAIFSDDTTSVAVWIREIFRG